MHCLPSIAWGTYRRSITVIELKGGIGKTATVRVLGVVPAGLGRRVLMVDPDP